MLVFEWSVCEAIRNRRGIADFEVLHDFAVRKGSVATFSGRS